jgi:nicotinamidase-related amidase
MKNRALLVIDMQKDLCYDLRRRRKFDQMIVPLRRAIDTFVAAECPVFYVVFSLRLDDDQFARFGDTFCIEGTEGAEIVSELLPLKGTVIPKKKHSAFFETELDGYLKKAGIDEVYLAGLQTQICIMTTAADASFRGLRAVVLSDCVLSTREKNKRYALEWIARYVGEVLTFDQMVEELTHAGNHGSDTRPR